MNISKVKDVVGDFIKSGFRFGQQFTDMIMDRIEASPQTSRIAGGTLDVLAGGGLTYMAVTSAIGTTLGVVGAVLAFTAAPVSAAVTIALAPVWLALSAMTGGLGVGMLDAAREKAGISRPSASSVRSTRASVDHSVSSVGNMFKSSLKNLTSAFKSAQKPKKTAAEAQNTPAPKAKDFDL